MPTITVDGKLLGQPKRFTLTNDPNFVARPNSLRLNAECPA